jgi:hypothetical protein
MKKAASFLRLYRSELLMWLFIVLLAASPVADTRPRVGFAMAIVFFVSTLYGASFMAESRVVVRIVLPLAVLWMVTHVLELLVGSRYFFSPYIGLLLSCSVAAGILMKFDDKSEISRNLIAEAVISYLVIAVGFSQLYWILDRMLPNAFRPAIPSAESSTYLYFSLTTLTTVGFGDIQPMNHYVRFFAAFEAVVGVFYLAIIIARLVAGYRQSH